jgi:DUF4097 and DUF4098 domain-containing protein YvlB
MKRHSSRLILVALAAVFLVAGVTTPVSALEDIQFTDTKTFEVGKTPDIELQSIAGDISYTAVSGQTATVEITIDVRAKDREEAQSIRDEIEVVVRGDDRLLEARVERPDDFSRWLRHEYGKDREISVSFHITGPAGATGTISAVSGRASVEGLAGPVDVSTVSGDLSARRVAGRLDAGSVSGRVEIEDCGGRLRANTVSGDLTAKGCGDDIDAETVSGGVEIESVNGRVDVSSVSGDVYLTDIEGAVAVTTTSGEIDVAHRSGDADLETVSGDITARSESQEGELVAESMSGSIDIYAKTDNVGRVALATFSGQIRLDDAFGYPRKSHRSRHDRGRLRVTLGDGDLDLRVRSHSGDIHLFEL